MVTAVSLCVFVLLGIAGEVHGAVHVSAAVYRQFSIYRLCCKVCVFITELSWAGGLGCAHYAVEACYR
jgi:hypothetical protein